MKKKILMFMLAVVFALGCCLAGCGDASSEEEETTEAETTTEAATEEAAEEAPTGPQDIELGNVALTIPETWVYDDEDSSEMTRVYKTADGSVEFQIEAMQASSTVDEQVLGEMTQKYADEWGYGDIGYYDQDINGIAGKIIPVDATQHPDGKNQRIYTLGKDKTVVALSFTVDGEDFTEMNEVLGTVHWLF